MLQTMLDSVPLILTATIIIAISYVIAKFISKILEDLLAGIGFNNILKSLGIKQETKVAPASIV
jgi:hypothetical protein